MTSLDLFLRLLLITAAVALAVNSARLYIQSHTTAARIIYTAMLPVFAIWAYFYLHSLTAPLFTGTLPFEVWLSRIAIGLTLAVLRLIQQVVAQVDAALEENS